MTYDQWKTDGGYSEKTPEQENEGRDCPLCGGDCSAANPPVLYCPMTEAAKGQVAVFRKWAAFYEEWSHDTAAGLMTEAAEALEAQEQIIETLTGELRRVTDHLASWVEYHSHECTAEIDAAIYCARAAIAQARKQKP